MRPSALIIWALPSLITAQSSSLPPAQTSENNLSLPRPSQSITSPPTQTPPSTTPSYPEFDDIDILAQYTHPDLRPRQGPVVTAAAPATTVATQVPPETVYTIYSIVNGAAQLANIPYTQLFSAVPDQWSSPAAGSIGLGTIAGQVGIVRTSKRGIPEATATPGQVLRIRGREVVVP